MREHSGENKSIFRIYVVLNPIAGNAGSEDIHQILEDRFSGEHFEYEVYETTGNENLAEITRHACGRNMDLVVAAGGDGTVAGVVNGLIEQDVPLGILPLGTGNGLARALHIPLDAKDAVSLLAGEHCIRPIDAMRVGDHYYILNVSVGISAKAMATTPPETKQRFGILAYVGTILQEALRFRIPGYILTLDGRQMQVRASEILVSNVSLLENPPDPLGPPEKFQDGELDVYIITARNLSNYLTMLWGLFTKPKEKKQHLNHIRVRQSIEIDSTGTPQPTQGDGEKIGHTPIEVHLTPKALKVVVPKEQEELHPASYEKLGPNRLPGR
jgi:diacylglycerol kinase (ATP)